MTKRILSAALALAVSLSLAVPAFAAEGDSPFSDVPVTHWAFPYVRQAFDEGIISGMSYDSETGEHAFAPDGPLTAAQYAAIVTQAFYWQPLRKAEREWSSGNTEPIPCWYALYQQTAEQAGLMEGVGVEDWEAPMTRYQMARMLYNIAADKELEPLAAGSVAIDDLHQVPEQYKKAVKFAYQLGLLSGVDDKGTFAGDQGLTRAQAAVVFAKLDKALEVKDGPMERALDKAERRARQNDSFLSTTFTRYPGKLGTAYHISQGGTPHGSQSSLHFVALDGTELHIRQILPEGYIYGSYWSLDPAGIQLDETGEKLSFVTRVQEQIEDPETAGGFREGKDWGDTRIVVNVVTGKVESMEPVMPFDLTEWNVASEPDSPLSDPAPALHVTIKNDLTSSVSSRPYIEDSGYPHEAMSAILNQNGVRIIHQASCILDPEFPNTDYGKAFAALQELKLPSITQDNFSPENTPEQREQGGRYFQVLLNGAPVSGNLWWSQGNNHRDLEFTFDQPVALKEGDTLTVRLGQPRE